MGPAKAQLSQSNVQTLVLLLSIFITKPGTFFVPALPALCKHLVTVKQDWETQNNILDIHFKFFKIALLIATEILWNKTFAFAEQLQGLEVGKTKTYHCNPLLYYRMPFKRFLNPNLMDG